MSFFDLDKTLDALTDYIFGKDKTQLEKLAETGVKAGVNWLIDKIFNKKDLVDLSYTLYEVETKNLYGTCIPIIYGIAKVVAKVIWCDQIRTSQHRYKDKVMHTTSIAVAIAEGSISSIKRIWINDELIDWQRYNVRIYMGTEEQNPDPLMIKRIGKHTPAYRGLAYAVFENFALESTSIPTFAFEVQNIVRNTNYANAEDLVESIVMIPGSGEFVYDTKPQYKIQNDIDNFGNEIRRGVKKYINKHTYKNQTNSLMALDDLQTTLPNIKWIAVVTGWFATDLDIYYATIKPGVEYKEGNTSSKWSVNKYTRQNAHLITQNNKHPIYGGTPDDQSLLRFLQELRQRGYKIMLYPFLFIDQINKPWRGRMHGSASAISNFFHKEHGYNNFIIHYANLCKEYVDAFIIGSEMVGLNHIQMYQSYYPAVSEFVSLAAQVKKIVSDSVLVSYAADWSEYHHTEGGWYHLDELWSSNSIDFIGIDAYFPLTENSTSKIEDIMKGWSSGLGYDYIMHDNQRQQIAVQYAWKNIRWWWENDHINPNGATTSWIPKSKKIWFTEYGFPSVDSATNQPNVFWSHDSIESFLPRGSSGAISLNDQRNGIIATELYWRNSDMIERKFLWTWDARPFPYWPCLKDEWNDGICWYRGHWVQGKLGQAQLSAIVAKLCTFAEVNIDALQVHLDSGVDGLIINQYLSIEQILQLLSRIYFFHYYYENNRLYFRHNFAVNHHLVEKHNLLLIDYEQQCEYKNTIDLKHQNLTGVTVQYIDRYDDYKSSVVHYGPNTNYNSNHIVKLPIITHKVYAATVARTLFMQKHFCIQHYVIAIDNFDYQIEDILIIKDMGILKITKLNRMLEGRAIIHCVNFDLNIYKAPVITDEFCVYNNRALDNGQIYSVILDIPFLYHEWNTSTRVLVATCNDGGIWRGAKICTTNTAKLHTQCISVKRSSAIGFVFDKLWPAYSGCEIDIHSKVYINLIAGEIHSIPLEDLFFGSNTAVIGNEIIQFQKVRLIKDNQYEISLLLRGLYGTEDAIAHHQSRESFVLLDDSLTTIPIAYNNAGQQYTIYAIKNEEDESDCNQDNQFTIEYTAKELHLYSITTIEFSRTETHIKLTWRDRYNTLEDSKNGWGKDIQAINNISYIVQVLRNGAIIYYTQTSELHCLILKKDYAIFFEETREYTVKVFKTLGNIYHYSKPWEQVIKI